MFVPVCDYPLVNTVDQLPSDFTQDDNSKLYIVGTYKNGYVYRFQWNNRAQTGSWNKVHYFDKGNALEQRLNYEIKQLHNKYKEILATIDSQDNLKSEVLDKIRSHCSIDDVFFELKSSH